MKRIISLLSAIAILVPLTACGSKKPQNDTPADTGDGALATLTTVWDSYAEDEKFAVNGGDYDHVVANAPGDFDISDAASLDSILALPEASAALIDEAASIVHMMNANTFTCGAFHAANAADAESIAGAVEENIKSRQWMCGFPDKLVIVTSGSCVVSMFGAEDLVNTFRDKLLESYGSATVVFDEAVL